MTLQMDKSGVVLRYSVKVTLTTETGSDVITARFWTGIGARRWARAVTMLRIEQVTR